MKNHVTNKDFSIKLKEAGFEQKSEFYWCKADDWILRTTRINFYFESASAYLTTELLKWLPGKIFIYKLTIIKTPNNRFVLSYEDFDGGVMTKNKKDAIVIALTLQDALAEMLLYLKKEGLI